MCVPFFFLDITFIHEGNKTFHDNLVNFEKLVSLIFWAQIHILATNIRPVIHPVSLSAHCRVRFLLNGVEIPLDHWQYYA